MENEALISLKEGVYRRVRVSRDEPPGLRGTRKLCVATACYVLLSEKRR